MSGQNLDDPETMLVSTGKLPARARVQLSVDLAYQRFLDNREGELAEYYPALAQVPADRFGICIAGIDGQLVSTGDARFPFTIMSISKPFIFALVCQVHGAEQVRQKLGVNSTGLPFNSILAVEQRNCSLSASSDHLTNPMVNPGAIAATSLVPGESIEAKWQFIHQGLSRFAGRELSLNEEGTALRQPATSVTR
jgi:glutaminase